MWERYFFLINKHPLSALSDVITVLPVLIGFIYYKYLSKESKLLFYFSVVHFLIDIYSTWLSVKKLNNLSIFNFTELLEVSTICIIFWKLIQKPVQRNLIICLFLTTTTLGLWKFNFSEFAFVPYLFNRLSYIAVVFIYFSVLLSEISVKSILLHSPFWLCAALTIYSTGSMIIFLFGEQILSSTAPNDKFMLFYDIISVINIIFRLLICVSFFVSKYEKT